MKIFSQKTRHGRCLSGFIGISMGQCNRFYAKTSLTHFQSIFRFYTPWKYQRTSGLLMFSGYKSGTLVENGLRKIVSCWTVIILWKNWIFFSPSIFLAYYAMEFTLLWVKSQTNCRYFKVFKISCYLQIKNIWVVVFYKINTFL